MSCSIFRGPNVDCVSYRKRVWWKGVRDKRIRWCDLNDFLSMSLKTLWQTKSWRVHTKPWWRNSCHLGWVTNYISSLELFIDNLVINTCDAFRETPSVRSNSNTPKVLFSRLLLSFKIIRNVKISPIYSDKQSNHEYIEYLNRLSYDFCQFDHYYKS